MATAWSPPRWMKSNQNWTGFSVLKTEFYQAWADYHLRYIELMDAKNMPIWSITTGNEPLAAVQLFMFAEYLNLGFVPSSQAVWLNDYLGPTIRKSKYRNISIFGVDNTRFIFPSWLYEMNYVRPGVLDYLDGYAVQWYIDDTFPASLIDLTLEQFPGKIVINSESCIREQPLLGSWERGEIYALDFVDNLQHSYNGWIDWNIVLDEEGGPNYVRNFVDAPVIVNATNRAEIYKQPIFYAMGHFSKFIPEGSVRIEANISSTFAVKAIAFKRPDERVVVVLLNSDESATDVLLYDSVLGAIKFSIPANSWNTLIYN